MRHPHTSVALVIGVVLSLAAGACGRSDASPSPLTVAAPTALRAPLFAVRPAILGRHPGWSIDLRFADSTTAPASMDDVVITSDPATMDNLVRARAVETPHRLAHDLLEIAVPAANPHQVQTIADLARPGLRVALVDSATPAGAIAAAILDAGHLHLHPTVTPTPAAALDLLTHGQADAVLLLTSDLTPAPPGLRTLPATPLDLALVTYQVAVVKQAPHHAAAQVLATELLDAAQAPLRDHGFLSP